MFLKNLAKIICIPGTTSMHTPITVNAVNGTHTESTLLWKGEAKDLINFCNSKNNDGWIVDEIRDRENDGFNDHIPYYNRGKIISVI